MFLLHVRTVKETFFFLFLTNWYTLVIPEPSLFLVLMNFNLSIKESSKIAVPALLLKQKHQNS